jgi:uncharacterized protein with PQ loop repeat
MCEGHAIEWIYDLFGDCIITPRDKTSFAIGLSSNFLWVCSAIPQIYQNFRTKRVKGQHPFFIGALLLGDIFSLIGILITHGLATQIITNTLYVILDGTMFAQFVIFNYIYQNADAVSLPNREGACDSTLLPSADTGSVPELPSTAIILGAMAVTANAEMDWKSPYEGEKLIGTVFGWLGCIGYMLSGEPQIHKNMDRKSVDDVSPYYLALIIAGNGTYTLAVMMRKVDMSFWWAQAPWLLGSIWPMCADIIVACQMCYYGRDCHDFTAAESACQSKMADYTKSLM